jgi:signal transduction histidine kinase
MAGHRNQLLGALRAGPGAEAPPESLRTRIAIVVLAGAASLILGLSGSDSLLHGLQGHPWPLRAADVVFGAIGYVLLWWRRRWPLGFAGYILVVSTFSTLSGGLPFVAALTVAIHRSWPTAVVTSVLLTAAAWPSALLYPESSTSTRTLLLTAAVIMFAVTGWGMYLRARRLLLASLRGRAERAEQSREEHARHARIAERQRIAREMHDVLAHRLSLLSVQAGALEVTPATAGGAAGGTDESVTEAAAAIRATTHQALRELRSIVRVLRDDDAASTSAPQPVAADLPTLVAESSAAAAIDADWGGVALATVPAQSGRTLYRIVQEGLTNARKHAPASSVDVRLAGSPEQGLAVTVTSWLPVGRPDGHPDGPTGPTGPNGPDSGGSGAGLIGLRERAALAGGHVDVTVTPDDRFRLSAWLPWEDR